MMQNFEVEIHSVEMQTVVQVVSSPLISGSATITRVPDGSTHCMTTMAERLFMVPWDSHQEMTKQRRDEEVQIARRLSTISSRVYIGSSQSLSCIVVTPWFLKADALLDANKVEEALSLVDNASQTIDDMQFDAERLVSTNSMTNLTTVP
jgi:hypothetical protein